MNLSIFEAIMLICFGSAWPLSIFKSLKSKTNKGKSIFFLIILFIGYISGIIHKILFSFNFVIIFYIINAIMVSIDILLYVRYYFLDKKKT